MLGGHYRHRVHTSFFLPSLPALARHAVMHNAACNDVQHGHALLYVRCRVVHAVQWA